MAYYCRAYAMDQAMLLRDQSNQKEVRLMQRSRMVLCFLGVGGG